MTAIHPPEESDPTDTTPSGSESEQAPRPSATEGTGTLVAVNPSATTSPHHVTEPQSDNLVVDSGQQPVQANAEEEAAATSRAAVWPCKLIRWPPHSDEQCLIVMQSRNGPCSLIVRVGLGILRLSSHADWFRPYVSVDAVSRFERGILKRSPGTWNFRQRPDSPEQYLHLPAQPQVCELRVPGLDALHPRGNGSSDPYSPNITASLLADYLVSRMAEDDAIDGLSAALSKLPDLQEGMDINSVWSSQTSFKQLGEGGELKLFRLCGVELVHGWLAGESSHYKWPPLPTLIVVYAEPESPEYAALMNVGDYDACVDRTVADLTCSCTDPSKAQ